MLNKFKLWSDDEKSEMTIVGKIHPEGNINLSLIGVCKRDCGKEKETTRRQNERTNTQPAQQKQIKYNKQRKT